MNPVLRPSLLLAVRPTESCHTTPAQGQVESKEMLPGLPTDFSGFGNWPVASGWACHKPTYWSESIWTLEQYLSHLLQVFKPPILLHWLHSCRDILQKKAVPVAALGFISSSVVALTEQELAVRKCLMPVLLEFYFKLAQTAVSVEFLLSSTVLSQSRALGTLSGGCLDGVLEHLDGVWGHL